MNQANTTLTNQILKRLARYQPEVAAELTGTVIRVADEVAQVSGLAGVASMEMVEFPNNVFGVAVNLESEEVGVIVLGDYLQIKAGVEVKNTRQLLSVPVSTDMIGRVVDPLGRPLDQAGEIRAQKSYPLEKIAPGVVERESVSVSLATGIKAIDAMIPIGRGQRELIIGDRRTGKTQIAIDTILNQTDGDVIAIYVAIGQRRARVAQVVEALQERGAMKYTLVVSASSSDPASLQYLAPYAGCAIGEYFMDQGKDVLIIYDDLTKHAWSYRQVSLILRRPSGREAYPGDIFYLHSRLLERACRLNKNQGGGSLTALPIIETQVGDLSAYIPTNVISITDGQIFLEPDLFNAGIRPAISVGSSVSRVGGSAQIKAMKQVAGKLRLDLAQYRALAAFVQFASDLDPATKAQIDRGARMTEILKQPAYAPMPVAKQVIVLWAGTQGYVDDIDKEKVSDFERDLLKYMDLQGKKVLAGITKEKKLTDVLEKKLKQLVIDFKESWMKENKILDKKENTKTS